MPRSIDDFDYLQLSPAERLVLIQDILDSVVADAHVEPLTREQLMEMERRTVAIDAGTERTIPWEEARPGFLRSA